MMSKNVMVVGVDGQGTLLTSRILGKLAIGAGYDVKLSEIHDMAQRDGSVATFMRYGEKVVEPVVKEDQTDVLIAFERLEVLRYLHFLKKDGVIIIDDWHIDLIVVVAGVAEHPKGIIDRPREARRTIVVEATEEARKMDAPEALSVVVLGAAVKHMGFEKEGWLKMIEIAIPPKTVEINKKASKTDYAFSV